MPDVRVTTWNELSDALYAGGWQDQLARFRPPCAFRGTDDADEPLTSGLARLTREASAVETHILRAFRKYASRDAIADPSVWEWLALAQHHGLPTRLLDFTFSPLVALHFATDERTLASRDAAVWCVDFSRTNERLPSPLKRRLCDEGSNVFTAEMLAAAAPSLDAFDQLSGERFVAFFEPPSLDDRIVNQFALFSLMSDPAARLDEHLAQEPASFRRVIVPAALKPEVRDKLDQANVNERVLLPGLDGLCRWLARYYGPR